MRYQGHLPDGSSVQAHSAGGLYPYVLIAQETRLGLMHGYIDPLTGRTILLSLDYEHSAKAVQHVKEGRERSARRDKFLAVAPKTQLSLEVA
jgi:hypothetical protein